ncbi:MAG: flagellar biosynthetic protein FliQ [Gammaproteobacteria bacterium]|nr:MAG: flagellar biosynthetic protein FliQ [Gammaproteobacteria bacterium]
MTPDQVITVGAGALQIATILMLVLLVPALVVGLVISMLQAATQINEVTLSFIPKLLVTLLVMIIGGPWMLRLITDFTLRLFHSIPGLIG